LKLNKRYTSSNFWCCWISCYVYAVHEFIIRGTSDFVCSGNNFFGVDGIPNWYGSTTYDDDIWWSSQVPWRYWCYSANRSQWRIHGFDERSRLILNFIIIPCPSNSWPDCICGRMCLLPVTLVKAGIVFSVSVCLCVSTNQKVVLEFLETSSVDHHDRVCFAESAKCR